MALTSCTTNDSSQRSECIRHNAWWREPWEADLSGAAQHVGEFAGIFFSQHSFFGAHTKDDLLRIAE
ncbi:MAG: hypothetical protein DMG74_12795 [Acidobacteria bacterium]|nr:MAG: hypothetical protein DMG74_12795 [Acidobacteriota bacterium]